MIYLTNASDKLQLEVTATPGTPLHYYCSYKIFDENFAAVNKLARTKGTLADTTPVDLAAIGSLVDSGIAIEYVFVTNKDASARTVLIKVTDGVTTEDIFRAQIPIGGQLVFGGGSGPEIRTSTGALDVP